METWAAFLATLAAVIQKIINLYESKKSEERTAAIRADPAGEWLRKLGGKSASSSSATDTQRHSE